MEAIIASDVFQVYIGAVIILGMNLLVLANNTALSRAKVDEAINPEDKKLNQKATVVYNAGNDLTERYRRAHRNALENILLFLITGFLLALTSVPFLTAAILYGIFVFARVFHSLAYMKGMQPWRTGSFFIGALDQIALLGFLGYYVYMV